MNGFSLRSLARRWGIAGGVLTLLAASPSHADITGGVGSGTLTMEIAGEGTVASVGPGAIPRFPGGLGLGGGGGAGTTTGGLALTWIFSPTTAFVFSPQAFLSQAIPSPLPGPEPGIASLHGDFSVDFAIDAAGVPASSSLIAYSLRMIVDGRVGFDFTLDYTSAALGAIGSQAIHFSRTTSGGFATVVSSLTGLPALPGGDTLTLSGTVDLSIDDNPGGSATQIVASAAPEPGTLILAGLGLSGLGAVRWRRRGRPGRDASRRG